MKINSYLQNILKNSGEAALQQTNKTANARSAGLDSQLKEMGVSSSADMQAAYKIYQGSDQQPTKAVMGQTQKFLEGTSGSSASKLLTIQVASAKGVDITEDNLTAIHTALNDQENQAVAIEGLLKEEFESAEQVQMSEAEIAETVKKLPEGLKKEVYAALRDMGYSEEEAVKIGNQLMAAVSKGISGAALQIVKVDSAKAAGQLLGLESKIKVALITLEATGGKNGSGGAVVDQPAAGSSILIQHLLEKLIDEAGGLTWDSEAGLSGHETIKPGAKTSHQVLQNDQTQVLKPETEALEPEENLPFNNEAEDYLKTLDGLLENALSQLMGTYGQADLQAMFESSQTKTYLVTEVTVKMINVQKDFETFKKEAVTTLEKALENVSPKQMAEVAAKVAEKLDKLIMQSDLTLYTDMKTEKKLVGLSSDLQKVMELVKTDPLEALNWLKTTKQKLDKLLFQPSKEKVQVFMKDNAQSLAGLSQQEFFSGAGKMGNGAKSVLDLMRTMGLNHEPELMDAVFAKETKNQTEEGKSNLKQMLLKLSAEAQEDQHLVKSIEKGLSQLTGQQLLNKPELQNDSQSLFFNLPLKLGDETTQMKLFVKSRKSVEKMDWENCSLYFMIDLKQYGETGIRIQSSQRQLSISVSNESDEIMAVIEPLAQGLLQELKDIGYNPGEIRYVPFSPEKTVPSELPKAALPAAAELDSGVLSTEGRKGFELKI